MSSTTYQLGVQRLGSWLLGSTINHTNSKSIAESLVLSETVVPGKVLNTAITESLVLSDTLSKNVVNYLTLTESLLAQLPNQLGKKVLGLWLLGGATKDNYIIDRVSYLKTLAPINVSENLTLVETINQSVNYSKSIQESLQLSDSIAKYIALSRALEESLTDSKSGNTVSPFPLSLVGYGVPSLKYNSISIDFITRLVELLRSIQEDNSLSDSIVVNNQTSKSLTESLVLDDIISRIGEYSRVLQEALVLLDELQQNSNFTRSVTETIGQFTESLQFALGKYLLHIADSTNINKTTFYSINTIANIDKLTRNASKYIREIADSTQAKKLAVAQDYARPNNPDIVTEFANIQDDPPVDYTEPDDELGTSVVPYID